eukprot:8121318-Prorocentrum_lima.AAC.1
MPAHSSSQSKPAKQVTTASCQTCNQGDVGDGVGEVGYGEGDVGGGEGDVGDGEGLVGDRE